MNETDDRAPNIEEETPHFPALEIDYDLYMKMLEESDWTDEQKREFIETIWSIVVSFVDLGFGIHPVQQAQSECVQVENHPSLEVGSLVSSWNETDAKEVADHKAKSLDCEAS